MAGNSESAPDVTALLVRRLQQHAERWAKDAAFYGGAAIVGLTPRRDVIEAVLPAERAGRKALDAIAVGELIAVLTAQAQRIETLTAERDEACDSAHYANGVAELAMKHRDDAETRAREAEALLAEARPRWARPSGNIHTCPICGPDCAC